MCLKPSRCSRKILSSFCHSLVHDTWLVVYCIERATKNAIWKKKFIKFSATTIQPIICWYKLSHSSYSFDWVPSTSLYFIYKYSSLFPNPFSYICSFIFDVKPKAESLIEELSLDLELSRAVSVLWSWYLCAGCLPTLRDDQVSHEPWHCSGWLSWGEGKVSIQFSIGWIFHSGVGLDKKLVKLQKAGCCSLDCMKTLGLRENAACFAAEWNRPSWTTDRTNT